MATILDATVVNSFSPLFIFLLIFIGGYAILTKIKAITENHFVNAIISFFVALLFTTSSTAIRTITVATPWLIMLMMVLLVTLVIFTFMGADQKDYFLNPKNTTTTVIIAVLIALIFVFSFGEVRREQAAQTTGNTLQEVDQGAIISFPGKVGDVLRDPSVLGLMLVFLVGTFTIMLLSEANGPAK